MGITLGVGAVLRELRRVSFHRLPASQISPIPNSTASPLPIQKALFLCGQMLGCGEALGWLQSVLVTREVQAEVLMLAGTG